MNLVLNVLYVCLMSLCFAFWARALYIERKDRRRRRLAEAKLDEARAAYMDAFIRARESLDDLGDVARAQAARIRGRDGALPEAKH